MGIFRALNRSASSVMKDTWKDYFYCDSLSNNVLLSRGVRRNAGNNNNGDENVITHGSTVIVNEGQAIIMVRNGEVVDICQKPGVYSYEYVQTEDIPAKRMQEGFKGLIAGFGERLMYAGEIVEDHRVYYVNTKDIVGNIFGTTNPIPFRVIDNNIGLDIDISIRCNGQYVFKIENPAIFYRTICGNVKSEFRRTEIEEQLKVDILSALHPAIGKLSEMGIRYNAIASHTDTILEIMDKVLDSKWYNMMGITLTSIAFGTIRADSEDESVIKELQRVAVFRNPVMASANLVTSQAEAMKLAASNPTAGPIMAFAGLNAFNPNMSLMYQMQQPQPQPTTSFVQPIQHMQKDSWMCSCGNTAVGNFCSMCGNKYTPSIVCPKCGKSISGTVPPKFCNECGTRLG